MIELLQSGVLDIIGIPVIDTVQSTDVEEVLETSVISRPLFWSWSWYRPRSHEILVSVSYLSFGLVVLN